MAYEGFKDFIRRTIEACNIAKNPMCDGYKRFLVSMVYKLFDEKTAAAAVKSETMQNKEFQKGKYIHCLYITFRVLI